MELYQLRTFVTVAEEEHLTKASERLFISQPAVSNHIKALEEQLGVELFTRKAKGVQLTEAGRILKNEAKNVLEAVRSMKNRAQILRGELAGGVRLGLNTDPAFLRVPSVVTYMRQHHPKLEFKLMMGLSGIVFKDIKTGKLDAGYVFGEHHSALVKMHRLGSSYLRIVAPAAMRKDVENATWPDIASMPWILTPPHCPFRKLADRLFSRVGKRPENIVIADMESIVRLLVIAGDGLGILREDEAIEAEKKGEVAIWCGDRLEINLSFAYLHQRADDPVIKALAEEVVKAWRDSPVKADYVSTGSGPSPAADGIEERNEVA